MRNAFIRTLCQLAREDARVVLLTGDLGYMVMEPFREAFPGRFFNVGVAEQNMIGMATGLAEAGLRPYTYSIAPFAALRPFEFVRNGPVLQRLPVRMVGTGMGFEYGHAGPTHYAVEDVGALRMLPALTIVVPADSAQAVRAIVSTAGLAGPVYYSLSKDEGSALPGLEGRFELGRLQVLSTGERVAIVTIGSVSAEAVAAAALLEARGVRATVAVVSTFNPDPGDDLVRVLSRVPAVVTVEAHVVSGGLGALVGGVIASTGLRCRLRALGVRTSPDGRSGSQADRWTAHHLDRAAIVSETLALLSTAAA